MENKPFDRSLMVPLALGGFSVIGILLVLLGVRFASSGANLELTPSATPLKYQFLATEPGVVTLAPTELNSPVAEATPASGVFVFNTVTANPVNTLVVGNPVMTATAILPSLGATYDDTDSAFTYSGEWLIQTDVSNAYNGTLHVSRLIGSAVQITFTGQKIRIVFQAGPGLGTVAVKLDSVDFALDQSNSETVVSEWESPILAAASHALTVTHVSGGDVNIDSITVVDVSTPMPTP